MDPAPTSPTHSANNTSSNSSSSKGIRSLFTRRSHPALPGHSTAATSSGGSGVSHDGGSGLPPERPARPTSGPSSAGGAASGGATSAGSSAADVHVAVAPPCGGDPHHVAEHHGNISVHGLMGIVTAPGGGVPDTAVQRLLVEALLDKPFLEGEIWFTVQLDWLNQWKRHVGILPPKKHYHHRQPPGPITTSRPFSPGYSAAKIHADSWRILLAWYGLAEGHKVIKQVAYTYGNRTEIETNLNTFDMSLGCKGTDDGESKSQHTPEKDANEFDPSLPCRLVLRLSKLERVGYVEWRARQMYHVPGSRSSRLWGKTLETDPEWRPLFRREAAIGRALEIESDFVRSSLLLEVADENGVWVNSPPEGGLLPVSAEAGAGAGRASGKLLERSIFDDVTTSWENEVHHQIDRIGKTLVRQIHSSLSGLMARARDFVAEREGALRDQDRDVDARQEVLSHREELLIRREADLAKSLREHAMAVEMLEQQRAEHRRSLEDERKHHMQEIEQEHWRLQQSRDALEQERRTFQAELQRMSELNAVQESRIKLDIGGVVFMTSRLTLTRDPNSMLAAMFSGRHQLSPEGDGSYFIDRDGTHFRYILNYLRDGGIKDGTLPHSEALWRELFREAEYYQISGLQDYVQGLLSKSLSSSRGRLDRRTP